MNSTIVLLVFAAVSLIYWGIKSLYQKLKGDKHQRDARKFAAAGDWAQASFHLKSAIIERLDSQAKLDELIGELSHLYESHGHTVNLNSLHACPSMIETLGSGKVNIELLNQLYAKTTEFLNSLPGHPIPVKK